MQTSKTGLAKTAIYVRIALHVVWKYRRHLSPRFLHRAARLLWAFYDNKIIVRDNTYKLHLYLPAYPTPAFFKAVEGKLLARPPKPISMVWGITKACSYKCPHCYQRLDKGTDLPATQLLQTVKAVSKVGVSFLNIEGGDVFLKFDKLCALLDATTPDMEVWINTTGAHVTREKLAILQTKNVYGFMVSLHSADAKTHDDFVGVPGAFEQAQQTLALCSEMGFGTAINTVLQYKDIQNHTLEQIMEIADGLHCGFVQLIHPKRAGKWLSNTQLYAQDKELITYVKQAYYRYNKKPHFPALPAQAEEEDVKRFGCTAGGVDRFYIGASGEVQPCEFLNISFGNLTQEPFEVIFKRMRASFPTPFVEWACEKRAPQIYAFMQQHNITQTPVPYEYTRELVAGWTDGTPTPIYKKIGIYEQN